MLFLILYVLCNPCRVVTILFSYAPDKIGGYLHYIPSGYLTVNIFKKSYFIFPIPPRTLKFTRGSHRTNHNFKNN